MNKKEFQYVFASEYSKDINDELNRSFRVIGLGLTDLFKDNIMKRELGNLIKEY
jgi:hypothetical protein